MKKDPLVYVDDMKDAILHIQKYAECGHEEFLNSEVTQDAVIRRLIVLGEAANKAAKLLQNNYPSIPWAQIIGMRNFIVHDYANVQLETIWSISQKELPKVLEAIIEIYEDFEDMTDAEARKDEECVSIEEIFPKE